MIGHVNYGDEVQVFALPQAVASCPVSLIDVEGARLDHPSGLYHRLIPTAAVAVHNLMPIPFACNVILPLSS